MRDYSQGDIVKITGFSGYVFAIVSKNAFIKATKCFHVCPIVKDAKDGPIHIPVQYDEKESGVVVIEQLKLIDPDVRNCNVVSRLSYWDIMNVSDALQGIFEYD